MRPRIDRRIDADADPPRMTDERLERADRLRVDERAGIKRGKEVGVGLADPVDHDPIRRCAGTLGQRELDRPDDLEADAIARQPAQQRRIGIRLDRIRDQRTGQRLLPGAGALRRRVEIGHVQRRAPAIGGLGQ